MKDEWNVPLCADIVMLQLERVKIKIVSHIESCLKLTT